MHPHYALSFACLIAFSGLIMGAEPPAPLEAYQAEASQARGLLAKAVAAYKEEGETVLAQLSRQGRFTAPNTYVYVINTQGVMLASGGPSAIYIGRDIRPMLDDELKNALNEALSSANDDVAHSREYHWMNWQDGKRERKRVYFQRVGDKVFAAGYYMPRSSPQEAAQLLGDAVSALQTDPRATLEKINRLDAFFNRDDLYVFVIDDTSQKFAAHGADHRLVGTDIRTLRGADGELIGPRLLAAVKGRVQGEAIYAWRNPVTGNKEQKHTLMKRQGNFIVAVGYYATRPTP
ncbi:cytochrome c [Pseudomonas sp. JAI111]|uniref:cache domain-containing protein n=1 Tax=Pseudomonas sp. JAI111 TaxID=2735913 RepID=UPI0021673826|nr:cache domain-containing protein [Pseudomonas sp. JAI111]MCS3835713.1 cytochrome c [Pseudomonas sp. JAI111]